MSNKRHCPHCHCSTHSVKIGRTSSGRQRYKCRICHHTWTSKSRAKRLTDRIWHDFVWNNQTSEMLARAYHKHPNTIRKLLHQYQLQPIGLEDWSKASKEAVKVIIMDTTYFGHTLGVVSFIDAYSGNLLYFNPIDRTEIIQDYIDGLEMIRQAGINPEACVVDGRKGLINAMEYRGLKVQVCLFHVLLMVKRYVTNKPILEPNKEIKLLAETLCSKHVRIDRFRFASLLHGFFVRNEHWLKERTKHENGKWEYTHIETRRAYQAIQKHFPWLFTYEKYPELHVPRTSNRIEGRFGNAKDKLKLHHGYTKELKIKILFSLLSGETEM